MMGIRTMSRDESGWILEKDCLIEPFADGERTGKISLIRMYKVAEPFWVECGGKQLLIADDGYSWVQLALKDQFFWMTAMFDAEDRFIEIYIDLTDGNVTEVANPYFSDLYLDYVLTGNEVYELDRDELDEASQNGTISRLQYERTLYVGDRVREMLGDRKAALRDFFQAGLFELKNHLGERNKPKAAAKRN